MDLYEPLEVIGAGAFGKVTKIRRKNDNRTLVWKELNYGSMNEREKQQIVAEVNIIRDLRSPFIVRYYDRIVDKQNCKLYIVMEYCAGGDLGQVIKKCKRNRTNLEESIIWRTMAQLLLALKDCHHREDNGERRPILHRDIKPANILLDQYKNIKLGDFGLAKELSSAGNLAKTHVGTPFYMSPELISGNAYDEKSDIWAIGCLLYELAALRPPFDANNQLELAMKIKSGKYHRIPSKYSNQLVEVIGACLQVDSSRRPRLGDIEAMTHIMPLQIAIGEAKKISKDYEMYQNYSDKYREVKAREDAVKAREDAVKAREDAVKAREDELNALIEAQKQREEQQQIYSDIMDVDQPPGEARMSLCPNETRRPTQPAFAIHHDSRDSWEPSKRADKPSWAHDEGSKENEGFHGGFGNVKRSATIDSLLARASALTQHRDPPPIPTSVDGSGVAKKPLLGTHMHSTSPGNPEAIKICQKGDEGSASKRRRRSDCRAPPPPPRAQHHREDTSVQSVHVDLRTLLPNRNTGTTGLRPRSSNAPPPPIPRRSNQKQVGSGHQVHFAAAVVNEANML